MYTHTYVYDTRTLVVLSILTDMYDYVWMYIHIHNLATSHINMSSRIAHFA